jgi:hypothetical protein
MAADDYLRGLLAKYSVSTDATSPLRTLATYTIYPVIQRWAGEHLREVTFSGSFAKGTANNCSNDLDLFISLASTTPVTLKDTFHNLVNYTTSQGWSPRSQDVSVGVSVSGYHIDLVPGRVQDGYQNWHSLYRRRADSWTQTNVQEHINFVVNSGRAEEIRLVKLWRHLAGLDFPSFLLELAVIEALSGKRKGNLAENFSDVLTWLGSHFQTARLIDPANTNNAVSDDLSASQKTIIANAARIARARPKFTDFVW